MRHEELKEDLSAFLDGELTPPEEKRLEEHLKNCAECRKELEGLARASKAFGRKGAVRAPEGLAEAVLDDKAASPSPRPAWTFAAAAAVILLVLLSAATIFKPQISGVFNQIMGMVSGAASTVGR